MEHFLAMFVVSHKTAHNKKPYLPLSKRGLMANMEGWREPASGSRQIRRASLMLVRAHQLYCVAHGCREPTPGAHGKNRRTSCVCCLPRARSRGSRQKPRMPCAWHVPSTTPRLTAKSYVCCEPNIWLTANPPTHGISKVSGSV
jgi:hypothetical protein